MRVVFNPSQQRAIAAIIALILIVTLIFKVLFQTNRAYRSDEFEADQIESAGDYYDATGITTSEEQQELLLLLDDGIQGKK